MRPGDVIDGKYQIEVELGEGGMGRVVAASHMAIGSTVAIKVLKAEALRYPEVPRRFMREARAAGRLRNEHVVQVRDVGQLPTGEPYMVMEMLHGADLSTRLKQGPVPPALAVEYIVQACEGLAEAHAMGMVHRDVKPANLFVTQRPNGAPLLKLLDFGIATAATGDIDHNLTSTLTVIGSPSYMSPEQLRAARDVDARSDIWSLGVTLYELLTGEQPFVGPTLTALTLKIVGEPHLPIHGVPPELSVIVDRCLQKQREHRFANVAQLAEALAPFSPNGRVAAEMVAGSLNQPVAPTLLGMDSSARLAQPTVHPSGASQAAYRSSPSSPAGYPAVGTPPPAYRPPTTTTDLTAGESALAVAKGGRRGAWIAIATVMSAAVIVVAAVVVMTGTDDAGHAGAAAGEDRSDRSSSPAHAPAPPGARPPATPDPAPVAPDPVVTAPASTPDPAATAPDPKPDPTELDPKPIRPDPAKLDPKPPPRVKRPPVKRPKDPRTPVEPTEYRPGKRPTGPVTDPTSYPVNDPKDPPVVKDPPPVKDPPVVKDPKPVPCAPDDPRCGL